MRAKDWEILKVGDRLTRITRRSVNETEEVRTADDFQVVDIRRGVVVAVRLVSHVTLPDVRMVVSETVELRQDAAIALDVDPKPGESTYTWDWNAPATGEARLTGGFIVTRADGTVEVDRCPTDTTR